MSVDEMTCFGPYSVITGIPGAVSCTDRVAGCAGQALASGKSVNVDVSGCTASSGARQALPGNRQLVGAGPLRNCMSQQAHAPITLTAKAVSEQQSCTSPTVGNQHMSVGRVPDSVASVGGTSVLSHRGEVVGRPQPTDRGLSMVGPFRDARTQHRAEVGVCCDVSVQLAQIMQRQHVGEATEQQSSDENGSQNINDALANYQGPLLPTHVNVPNPLTHDERAELEQFRAMFSTMRLGGSSYGSTPNQTVSPTTGTTNVPQSQPLTQTVPLPISNVPRVQPAYVDPHQVVNFDHLPYGHADVSLLQQPEHVQQVADSPQTGYWYNPHGDIYQLSPDGQILLAPGTVWVENPQESSPTLQSTEPYSKLPDLQQSSGRFAVGEASGGMRPSLVPREVKLERPLTFSGKKKEVQNFLFVMRQYIDSTGLGNGSDACRFLVSYLRDEALTWWRSYSKDSLAIFQNLELDTLMTELENYFSDIDREMKLRAKLFSLRQVASVAQYVTAFKQVQLELGSHRVADDVALHLFLQGLKPMTQQWVLLQRPENFGDACVLAERADASLSWQRRGNFPQQRQPQQQHRPNFQNIGHRNVSQYSNSRYKGPAPMVLGTAQKTSQLGQVICFHCGKTGHMKNKCWKLQNKPTHNQTHRRATQPPPPPPKN